MPEHKISLYNHLRPTRLRAYSRPVHGLNGSRSRKMRIRQIQMLPVRNSLRALPRTAQFLARFAEPAAAPASLIRAITKSTLLRQSSVKASKLVGRRTPVRAVAKVFPNFAAHFPKKDSKDTNYTNGHERFSPQIPTESSPHNISPGDPAVAGPLEPTNLLDGHGNGLPRQQSKPNN